MVRRTLSGVRLTDGASHVTKRLPRLAVVLIAAAALTVGIASPAAAFGPPSITVTPTTTGEGSLAVTAVECPVTSTDAAVTWTGTFNGAPRVLGPTSQALDVNGQWSDTFFLDSFFDRGTVVTFTVACSAAGVPTGDNTAAPTLYTIPDTGAVTSTPASSAIDADFAATGNCGSAPAVDGLLVRVFDSTGNTQIGSTINAAYAGGTYSVSVGSGTSLGLAVGDSVQVQVLCTSTTPSTHTTSGRISITAFTAAVVPPVTPAVTPAAVSNLAAAGTDSLLPLGGAVAILIAGVALVVLRRRVRA